jgi:hypothetical protein
MRTSAVTDHFRTPGRASSSHYPRSLGGGVVRSPGSVQGRPPSGVGVMNTSSPSRTDDARETVPWPFTVGYFAQHGVGCGPNLAAGEGRVVVVAKLVFLNSTSGAAIVEPVSGRPQRTEVSA